MRGWDGDGGSLRERSDHATCRFAAEGERLRAARRADSAGRIFLCGAECAAGTGMADPCESEVITQLVDLQRKASDYARRDGRIPPDEYFFAEQNARLGRGWRILARAK